MTEPSPDCTAQEDPLSRRPLRSRGTAWARWLAARLCRTRVTPNQISLASMGFALAGAAFLFFSPNMAENAFLVAAPAALAPAKAGPAYALFLILAAACVQLRLLCNLLDGMVAVEGGKKTPDGDLYNELPDRAADVLLLAAAGYAAGPGWVWLGWICAVLAVWTAYVRAFGASLGFGQDFSGIFSKPRRMALLTAACLCAAWEGPALGSRHALRFGLLILALGIAWTVATRTRNLARSLRARPGTPGRDSQ